MTAEQINQFIDYFKDIYDEKGNEINPIPEGVKLTVWCEGNGLKGFIHDSTSRELGLEALIAKKWILQSELEKLVNEYSL